MSQIPQLMNGLALEHDFQFEPGNGLGAKGQTALMTALSGATNLLALKTEAITAAANHTLLVTGTAAANQTKITSNIVLFDPGGSGRDLTLPAEASSTGLLLVIMNTADAAETTLVKDDGGGAVVTIAQSEGGIVVCDGTTWRGFVGGIT